MLWIVYSSKIYYPFLSGFVLNYYMLYQPQKINQKGVRMLFITTNNVRIDKFENDDSNLNRIFQI